MRIHIGYTRRGNFMIGSTWELSALEDGQLTFITEWMWDYETWRRLG